MEFKPTLKELIKMMNETVEDFDNLSFNIDDWSAEFAPVDFVYFDPFFDLDMPTDPWYGPQREQLPWDIRDFEPYEAGRLDSPNREEG
jgi:hypothetical protein